MSFRNRKVVIITGAGATRSEAAADIPDEDKPPLDKGFFAGVKKTAYLFRPIQEYTLKHYGIDPAESRHDSLENVMGVIYSDALTAHGDRKKEAEDALRRLLMRIPPRIADTTNGLRTSPEDSNLSGIVSGFLAKGCRPYDLSLVTFNYDLHAEKVLRAIDSAKDGVFSFPHCYQLPRFKVTGHRSKHGVFHARGRDRGGVRVLKLHGSLNWLSIYKSHPSAQEMLAPKIQPLRIIPHVRISTSMVIRSQNEWHPAYPHIVPPIVHKAGILSDSLAAVWEHARRVLQSATDVVIFGYSCPPQDIESANLISGGLYRNRDLASVTVIDPSSSVYRRYVDLTGLNEWAFYRDAQDFIKRAL